MSLRSTLFYLGVALAVSVALVSTLRLWEGRWDVPFSDSGDGAYYATLAKAVGEDGLLHFRHLGMPFGVDVVDWGAGMPLDLTMLGLLSRVSGETGMALNVWWLLTVVASGVSAAFAFRALRLPSVLAFGLGCLYALSPYAFARNVTHISLAYHFVPLLALLALATAEGTTDDLSPVGRLAVLAGCLAQGLSYIYYSFFGCLLLLAAGLVGWLRTKRLASVRLAAAGLLLVLAGTAASLAPSLSYWSENGRNPDLQYKKVSDADTFGLKIRHLLLPIPDHPLPSFRRLAERARAAEYPGDNENTSARLGTVGSLGFVGLVLFSLGVVSGLVRAEGSRLAGAAALTLLCLLVAQVGGLGTLFSLLVSPDIRAYNRLFVFILFFSLLAVGHALEWLTERVPVYGRLALRTIMLVLLVAAVFDQATTTLILGSREERIRRFDADRAFVRRVEAQMPSGAMVFQLPHTGNPVEVSRSRMEIYDQCRPYLHSRRLRWSWGGIVGRNGNWQAEVQRLGSAAFLRTIMLAGFSGVWIDRRGYSDETAADGSLVGARNPEAAIVPLVAQAPEVSPDGRYAFVSLEAARRRLLSELGPEQLAELTQDALRPPVAVRYLDGFGSEEGGWHETYRLCSSRGSIAVRNTQDRERTLRLTARLRSTTRAATIAIEASSFREVVEASREGTPFEKTLVVPSRRRALVHFSCSGSTPGGEGCFELVGARVVDLTAPASLTLTAEDPDAGGE